jgi:hypothetical protein
MILGVIEKLRSKKGGVGYILLWVMGVPLPVLLLISLLRGCN